MCVIYACSTAIPPEEELARGAFQNDDGAGIAWLEKVKGEDKVFWKKGLMDHKAILTFIDKQKIQLPMAIHFRTASAGGKCEELAHPFPLLDDIPLDSEGHADEVLFHNGHLSNWEDLVVRTALGMDVVVPDGDWSDTRALAWLAHLKGVGIIPFVKGTSRVLSLHAQPEIWEGCDYDRAHDHFTLWGVWAKQGEDEGWRQSTETAWGGGTVVRGRNFHQNHDRYLVDNDNEETEACSPNTSPVKALAPGEVSLNVWSVSELREVLGRIEKDLADARTAAGL